MLLAGFKLLISCDCSSEMNTSNFLVNVWPKPDCKKCQQWFVYTVYFRKDFCEGEALPFRECFGS